MASGPRQPRQPEERPTYTKYRSRPKLPGRPQAGDALEALRRRDPRKPSGPGPRKARSRSPIDGRRVAKWLALGLAGWLALSAVIFLISAQIQSGKLSGEVDRHLAGGFPLTSKNTILVLGSDARVEGQAEPGAQTIGSPSRSDSIMLIRTGGGAAARLSIPRDTVVDVPGHGRSKINAAYALGGAALAVRTVKAYLGIDINHVIEVDFANFPELIDAMGGIDVKTGCVRSEINGGRRNGGKTLRLKRGEHHIDGEQALILARTRNNLCNPSEDDLTRARRQQEILAAIKDRAISPWTFARLPWVSWNAPKAVRSDMSGPSLMGLVGSLGASGTGKTQILKPSGGETLPDGGSGLVVSEDEKRREARRFLAG
jgi:LCP family protein required for cell wall assembly